MQQTLTKMKCPHCKKIFTLTWQQLAWNTKFRCPHCHKFNDGSQGATKSGVLIGMVLPYSERQRLNGRF